MNNPLETLPTPVPGAPSAEDGDASGATGFPAAEGPPPPAGASSPTHLGVVPPTHYPNSRAGEPLPDPASDAVQTAEPPLTASWERAPSVPPPSGGRESAPAAPPASGGSRFGAPASVGALMVGFGLFALVSLALFALTYVRMGELDANMELNAARAGDEFAKTAKGLSKDVQGLKAELVTMRTQLADPKTKTEIRRMARAVHEIDQQIKAWAKAEQEAQAEAAQTNKK